MIEDCAAHQNVEPAIIFTDAPQSPDLDAKIMQDAQWIANHEQESLPEEVTP